MFWRMLLGTPQTKAALAAQTLNPGKGRHLSSQTLVGIGGDLGGVHFCVVGGSFSPLVGPLE